MSQAKPIRQSVYIPVELIQYVFDNRLFNVFKTFTAARMVTPGQFTQGDHWFHALCKALGLQPRSVVKHLQSLHKLDWVGYNKSKQTYYLRSITWFRINRYFVERHSVKAAPNDLPHFRALLLTAVLQLGIQRQKHYIKRTYYDHGFRRFFPWRPVESAVVKGGTALQDSTGLPLALKKLPQYLGYSNTGIGKKISYSKTRACEMKHEAEKAGYLISKPHYLLIAESDRPIRNWRKSFIQSGFSGSHKVRLLKTTDNGVTRYQLVYQLHDEITPKIGLIRIQFFKRVKQALRRSGNLSILPKIFTREAS
jgi:hypothetical protein